MASEAGSQLSLTPGFREAKGNAPVPKHKRFPSPNDPLLGSLALTSGQFNSQVTISEGAEVNASPTGLPQYTKYESCSNLGGLYQLVGREHTGADLSSRG